MAYTPQVWVNGSTGGTPLSASRFNYMEAGIEDADGRLTTLESAQSAYNVVQDEGISRTARPTLNFVGAGVTVTDDPTNTRTLVTIPGGAGGNITVQEEGTALTQRAIINFVGAGVTAADDAANARTVVTVSGGGGGAATETVHAVGNSGTALTVNPTVTGSYKTITLNGNCTLTFAGATAGQVTRMDLQLTQDATGGRTVTWPSSVKWVGGTPTLISTAGAVNIFTFWSPDGGTTWFGAPVGLGFA